MDEASRSALAAAQPGAGGGEIGASPILAHDGPRARALIHELAGDVDTTGLEILRLIKMIAIRYDVTGAEMLRHADLSGPRWRLLLRLYIEEALPEACSGLPPGVTPTHLSRCQNVSKNTISALLRGLEHQGLIERTMDPEDKRGFRIRLTASGRELVRSVSPQHLAHLNKLISRLSPEEQNQLTLLLRKLYASLSPGQPQPGDAAPDRAAVPVAAGN
jgi:DNA-binding MarR family transcriptional regulator